MNSRVKKIQALLFVSAEPIAKRGLAQELELTIAELNDELTQLAGALHDSGLALVTTETQVQLTTCAELGEWLASRYDAESRQLTPAAAETLAIIAYRGPVSRAEIESLRGVDSQRIVHQLVRRGLITAHRGRGQLVNYQITADLLAQLGITQVQELPEFDVLGKDEEFQEDIVEKS